VVTKTPAAAAFGLQLRHEQLARADVPTCALHEETVAAVCRLDDALDDAGGLRRDEGVVAAEGGRGARRGDGRRDATVGAAAEADDGQRRIGDAVGVEADGRL